MGYETIAVPDDGPVTGLEGRSMTREFRRVAIVNRGEPAMRLIHAVREMPRPMQTVALFTEPDQRAMFVREADAAVGLGPATFVDPRDGRRMSSYLDYPRLERALVASGADAAWVGWGFVAEHAEFAELCERLGIVFIGPTAAVMRRLADKISAKRLAEEAGLPVAPWSNGPVETLDEARAHATRLGYPLMLKASSGGGGRGIRALRSEGDLAAAFTSARAEALAAFGDATVFLERRVIGARHIEVQIVGDQHGAVWAAGVRDCTLQRRHQKVLEEGPSPALRPEEDASIRAAAASLARRAGYQGAGTVELLFDAESRRFSFMEVNARLQVEHPVTEATTGLDLVKLQLHVAAGGHLVGEPPAPRGHAIEVRLNAEDPENDFAPAPGRIEVLRLPTGPGVRVDTGVAQGDVVPPEFDSMIAKIIAWGKDRDEALARLRRALAETVIVVRGGTSNKAFLLGLLGRPEVQRGDFDTAWLDGLAARGEHVSREHGEVALLEVAAAAYAAEAAVERTQFFASAARGRPRLRAEAGRAVELGHRGARYRFQVEQVGPELYRIDAGAGAFTVHVERLGPFERALGYRGRRYPLLSVAHGSHHVVEVEGVPHRVSRDAAGMVRSPSPAMVLSLAVAPGAVVAAGDRLATLEAMKMEMVISAPFTGLVREVLVTANTQVAAGAPLVLLEPEGAERGTGAEALTFEPDPTPSGSTRTRWAHTFEELRRFLLGFDVDPREARRIAATFAHLSRALPHDDEDLARAEREVLSIFIDVHALFRRQPAADDPDGPEDRSTQEYFGTYLRELDTGGKGLPTAFLDKLGRALRHYGVETLERSPELEDALVRIYKAHARGDVGAVAVADALERGLGVTRRDADLRRLLERLLAVSDGRFPTVHDLTREARYRGFDQPVFEQARDEAYARVDRDLLRLAGDLPSTVRAELLSTMVDCPHPLIRGLIQRFEDAPPALRACMIEVLTLRYYRIRQLGPLEVSIASGRGVARAAFTHEGRRFHVFTTHARFAEIAEVVSSFASAIAAIPEGDRVVLDVYAFHGGPLGDADATERALQAAFARVAIPRALHRLVVIVGGPEATARLARVQQFTFRPALGGGYAEERLARGIHPMMGKRMHLWRLSGFVTGRLPSAEDVYLFHAVARDNARDERLFAVAEVRDLTPVRDASGRVVALPHLERMLVEALASMRLFQARRAPSERLQYNRVLLHVWPALTLDSAELDHIVRRMAPSTAGLGVEQVVVHAPVPDPATGALRERVITCSFTVGAGLRITFSEPTDEPVRSLSEYEQKVSQLRRRGLVYPYEIVKLLTPTREAATADFPPGEFVEHDLDARVEGGGALIPVDRPWGRNKANVVVGVIKSFTALYPEGMTRVAIFGDPSKEMGAVSEPEGRRICAALDLAEKLGVPVEWFALSGGAKIAMDSGTENMDWVAAVLRRLIEVTQAGLEVNVIVCGINVGAQPYWNAEATMLMHTRGILVMTGESAMVLTGKQALDYSGSVSAEDNQGIGGYERIMGPNGQAQYRADDISAACRVLLAHYDHTYLARGERFPRRAPTGDPHGRDVCRAPHPAPPPGVEGFTTIGEIFSDQTNPGRKKPFAVRAVMAAVIDQDHRPLERWKDMRDAETAVVWDARLGGHAVCLIGMESKPSPRLGYVPADGPDTWTAGTLFPRSSKKVARAINAATGNRPLVVLANLSGFDGSPESMRALQLEYGAEIGRAITNFLGPILFVVISRYHGGAFVVFSRRLNPAMEAVALEGSYASVIGGAPAAGVVFSREVDARTRRDPRLAPLEEQLAAAVGEDKRELAARLAEIRPVVRAEKLGEVADEFDRVHSVHRAREVGSLDRIIAPDTLRPYLIDALDRGVARALAVAEVAGHLRPPVS